MGRGGGGVRECSPRFGDLLEAGAFGGADAGEEGVVVEGSEALVEVAAVCVAVAARLSAMVQP